MPPAYEVLLLNTAVPQIQAAQTGDTYVVPRDIAFSAALTLSAGTANGVPYLNGSKVLTSGSALTFDGTNFATTGDINSEGSEKYINFRSTYSIGSNVRARIRAVGAGGGSGYGGDFRVDTRAPDNSWNTDAFVIDSSGQPIWTFGGSGQMRLTSTGLGIGTTSPGSKLTVQLPADGYSTIANTGSFTGPNSTGVLLASHLDGGGFGGDIVARGYSSTYGDLRFIAANGSYNAFVERMRLDSSGNLLLSGLTSSIGNYWLQLKNTNSSANCAYLENASGNDRGILIMKHDQATGATTGAMAVFQNASGSTVGSIVASNTATAYNISSDYRLKENIQPMTGALAKVAALKPCTYNWKADGSAGEGFIAHELAEVCPQAVTGEKDAVNEDNSIKPQGIDTSFLVATLTAAIQEQQAMINELKAEVAALKGN